MNDVDWVAEMPPKIIDHPPSGTYKAAVGKLIDSNIVASRDIVHCMLSYAFDNTFNEHNRKLIGISLILNIPF